MEPERRPRFSVLVALAQAALCLSAWAQPAPMSMQSQMAANMITMRDMVSNRILIGPNQQPVVNTTNLHPAIQLVPKGDGFDLVVNYSNPGAQPASLGIICIPGIRFGQQITVRNFLSDTQAEIIDHHGHE